MAIIREAAAVGALVGSRQEITLITPGWGSSGYYSPAVLEQAAKDRVFPAKTQMHIDHDGEMARYEQPAGSLTKLAAALLEDARWEPDWVDPDNPGALPGRLVSESTVMPNWREFLIAAKEFIGNSIVAAATFVKGEVDGRKGNIVEALHPSPLNRVDYVTVAGRGGRISAVLESAFVRKVTEATANETSRMLRDALREAYGAEDTWIWLRDHDDAKCWFEVEDPESTHVYEQAYASTDTTVTLTGDRVEVRATTTYVPVTPAAEAAPDSPSNPAGVTTEKEAATMATTTIEEAELATLKESYGRVPALETAATVAEGRATTAEAGLTDANDTAAAAVVEAAFAAAGITAPKTAERLSKGYPVKENGALNAEALAADVAESIAELQVASGAGTPRGVGDTSVTEKVVTAESARAEILAASGYTPKGA